MDKKNYYLDGLNISIANKINQLLTEGRNKVIGHLDNHARNYSINNTTKVFKKILEDITETIAFIASIPELHFDQEKTNKRISFLSGYINRYGDRIVYKLDNGISSDISYLIKDKDTVELIIEPSASSLLYSYLFEKYPYQDGFSNGGTHQYLINNFGVEKSNKYKLKFLHVSTDNIIKKSSSKMSLDVQVDFTKYNSIKKLYTYFDKIFNGKKVDYNWPMSNKDEKSAYTQNKPLFQVRGYLVCLWYKILFDKDEKSNKIWFDDCIEFASINNYTILVERLKDLRKKLLKNNSIENYTNWYSLVFEPDHIFGSSDEQKQSLGSAMLLSNFKLKNQFFIAINDWIDKMYELMKEFEYQVSTNQIRTITNEKKVLYFGDDKFIPKIEGENSRLLRAYPNYGHTFPLLSYYNVHFSKKSKDQYLRPYNDAKLFLNQVGKIYLILNNYQLLLKDIKNQIEEEKLKTFLDDSNSNRIHLFQHGFGFSSDLLDPSNLRTQEIFSYRLFGRIICLTLYSYFKTNITNIHSAIFNKDIFYDGILNRYEDIVTKDAGGKNFDESKESIKNKHRVLRKSFFIANLTEWAPKSKYEINRVISDISEYEKKFINIWVKDFQSEIRKFDLGSKEKNEILKASLIKLNKDFFNIPSFKK
jgi:hypothetical protein